MPLETALPGEDPLSEELHYVPGIPLCSASVPEYERSSLQGLQRTLEALDWMAAVRVLDLS